MIFSLVLSLDFDLKKKNKLNPKKNVTLKREDPKTLTVELGFY